MAASIQGATGAQAVASEGPRLGAIRKSPRWKHTKGSHPEDGPSPQAQCDWGNGWLLRTALKSPLSCLWRQRRNGRAVRLVQNRIQDQGGGPQMPACYQLSTSGILDRRSALGQWWTGGWPSTDCDTRALPQETLWVDPLAWTASKNANLVAGALRGSWPEWHLRICQKGAGIFPRSKGEMPHLQTWEWLLCATGTPVPGHGLVPATLWHEVWQPGLLADTAWKDPGLCQGPTTLGRESPATDPRQGSPTGRKCAGALTSHGTSNHIHWCWGSGQHPALQLGQKHIVKHVGAHRSCNYLEAKAQQEP